MAKSRRLELRETIFTDIICLSSTTVTWPNWLAKQSNSVKNAKIRAIRRSRSFKVIEVSIFRKPVWDFLLVINSNWHPISYRLGVIAAYCSNLGHCVFEPPIGRLRDNLQYVHLANLGLIGKRVVDFHISVEFFFASCYGWGATSENRSKMGDFAPARSVRPKISSRRGRPPPIIFARTGQWKPYKLQLCRWPFSHKQTL